MAQTRKNIPDTLIIPPACRETFLPLGENFAWPLRERGVVAAGVSDLTAGFVVGRARPPTHVVLGTVGGGARFVTPTTQGRLGPGDLWVGPAGQSYRYEAEDAWRVLWFHLAPRWAAPAGQDVARREMPALAAMLAAMEGFVSEAVRREVGADVAARAYAEVIGTLLDRELGGTESADARRVQRRLAALWEVVNADLSAPWTVGMLAERVCVSPAHLHRLCVRHHGLAPLERVNQLRMRRAETMLQGADYTLEQIASAVGYGTPFALSRAFKRHAGQSPRAFRSRPL